MKLFFMNPIKVDSLKNTPLYTILHSISLIIFKMVIVQGSYLLKQSRILLALNFRRHWINHEEIKVSRVCKFNYSLLLIVFLPCTLILQKIETNFLLMCTYNKKYIYHPNFKVNSKINGTSNGCYNIWHWVSGG